MWRISQHDPKRGILPLIQNPDAWLKKNFEARLLTLSLDDRGKNSSGLDIAEQQLLKTHSLQVSALLPVFAVLQRASDAAELTAVVDISCDPLMMELSSHQLQLLRLLLETISLAAGRREGILLRPCPLSQGPFFLVAAHRTCMLSRV